MTTCTWYILCIITYAFVDNKQYLDSFLTTCKVASLYVCVYVRAYSKETWISLCVCVYVRAYSKETWISPHGIKS